MLLPILATTTPRLTTLIAPLICLAAPVALADASDDTLKFFLSKSEVIVSGKIATEPMGITDELGVLNYICEFQVQDVLKGDAGLQGRTVKVNIMRFEKDAKDKHPLIKKDQECLLFLKSATPNTPSWVTADFWFGVQQHSPWMARSLKRLAAGKAEAIAPANRSQPVRSESDRTSVPAGSGR